MSQIELEVTGVEETRKKMEQVVSDLQGPPMLGAMKNATLLVQGGARRNLKPWRGPGTGGADTGRLRASITPQVVQRTREIQGIVGSNVFYAPFVELGTRPHFVPASAIGRWAERHGLGFRGVNVTGRALKFLQKAFESNKTRIVGLIGNAVGKIVRK